MNSDEQIEVAPKRRTGTSWQLAHTHQYLLLSFSLGILSLGISIWELKVTNVLSFYDSGTYLAGSMNLINGVLPYRDFTFVQPPGILLILSPVALLGKVFWSHGAFLLGRILTALVSALNVGILAWLLRERGRIAMLIGALGLALLPVGALETASIKLEPYCLFFILVASIVLLRESSSKSELPSRTLFIGGLLFGVAGLIKIFAFLPFLAMVIALYPNNRRRVMTFIGAAGTGFVVLASPFFIASPRDFTSEVLIEQLFRKSSSGETMGVIQRLIAMVGLSGTWLSSHVVAIAIPLTAAALFALVTYLRPPGHTSLDSFFLWASIFTVTGLLTAAQFINYYGYFSVPFLLGTFGIVVNRLSERLGWSIERLPVSSSVRRLTTAIAGATLMLLAFSLALYTTTYYSNLSRVHGFHVPAVAPVTKLIPAGACVIYDNVGIGITADRWPSSLPNCPHVIDPYGLWLAWGYHLIPAAPAFTAEWRSYFERAQFVVLGLPRSNVIPWNHGLHSWFAANYHLIYGTYPTYIYAKN